MHAEALWRRLVADWGKRRAIIREASATIGRWLIDERTGSHLRGNLPQWQREEVPRRIELVVPDRLGGWPWETADREPGLQPG